MVLILSSGFGLRYGHTSTRQAMLSHLDHLFFGRIHVLPVKLSVKDKLSNIRAISIGLMSDPLLSPRN